MSKHFEDGQYDDDLTIGVDDFDTDDLFAEVDLLKYKPFESPLAKLKSLVLSIDWEITDDILRQFNEELLALKEIWTGEKVYLVYIQALQTISKYIFQEKSSAHPNAVKLLPAFYYNLEKVVLDENLTEAEIYDVLLSDVERFNNLKKQLIEKAASAGPSAKTENVLHGLKTLVLGIDWEITEADLDELRKEILDLERVYEASKPKLILLQGIGTLAAYIRHKGANAHADAFSLLHDFYATLERISTKKMSVEEQKENLFVEVEKFNSFKTLISATISPEALSRDEEEDTRAPEEFPETTTSFQPAFADVEEDSVSGFQEEQVAASLDVDEDITNRLETFFSDEPDVEALSADSAPFENIVEEHGDVESEAEIRLDDFFKDDFFAEESIHPDKERALRGVDVETDADDDSEEEVLPAFGGEVAPALADNDEVSSFRDEDLEMVMDVQDDLQPGGSLLDDQAGDVADLDEEDSGLSFLDESSDFEEALTDIGLDSIVVEDSEEIDTIPQYTDSEDSSPMPALAAFSQDSVVEENDEPEFEDQLGLESTLDAFFGDFDDPENGEQAEIDADVASSVVTPTPNEQVSLLREYFDEDTEDVEDKNDLGNCELAVEESIESSVDQFYDFADDEEQNDDVVAHLSHSVELEEYVDEIEEHIDGDTDLAEVETFFDSPASETVASVGEPTVDQPEAIASEVVFHSSEPELSEESVVAVDGVDTDVAESAEIFFELVDEDDTVTDLVAENELECADSTNIDAVVTDVLEDKEALVTFLPVDENVPEDIVEIDTSFADMVVADTVDASLSIRDGESEKVVDYLVHLRSSIQSLGIQIDTQIITGLYRDINQLRQRAVTTSLDKSFLQLLSTIVQHIDRNRYLSSDIAYELVLSIFTGLEGAQSVSSEKGTQLLLEETYKVLQWQQNLIYVAQTQASSPSVEVETEGVGLGLQNTDSAPVLGETFFSEGEDELIYVGLEEELAEEDNERLSASGVDDIRSELQSLRKTLQDEISQLRAELLGK